MFGKFHVPKIGLQFALFLHFQVLLKDSKSIGTLLEASDRFDNTPLHVACERGYHAIALTLIEAGAEVDNKASGQFNPKKINPEFQHLQLIQEFIS